MTLWRAPPGQWPGPARMSSHWDRPPCPSCAAPQRGAPPSAQLGRPPPAGQVAMLPGGARIGAPVSTPAWGGRVGWRSCNWRLYAHCHLRGGHVDRLREFAQTLRWAVGGSVCGPVGSRPLGAGRVEGETVLQLLDAALDPWFASWGGRLEIPRTSTGGAIRASTAEGTPAPWPRSRAARTSSMRLPAMLARPECAVGGTVGGTQAFKRPPAPCRQFLGVAGEARSRPWCMLVDPPNCWVDVGCWPHVLARGRSYHWLGSRAPLERTPASRCALLGVCARNQLQILRRRMRCRIRPQFV
jgi:hypothetical protein